MVRSTRTSASAPARSSRNQNPNRPVSVQSRVSSWLSRQNRPRPRFRRIASEPFSEILATVKASLRRPAFVLLLVIGIAFILSHGKDQGPIYTMCSGSSSAFCTYATTNSDKLLGMVVFVIAAWDSPRSMSAQVMIASIFWVLLVPEPGLWAYAVQAVLLHTFLWVKSDSSKLVVLALTALAYAFGYIPIANKSG